MYNKYSCLNRFVNISTYKNEFRDMWDINYSIY